MPRPDGLDPDVGRRGQAAGAEFPARCRGLSAIPRAARSTRAALAFDRCRVDRPEPQPRGTQAVACHLYDNVPAVRPRHDAAPFVDVSKSASRLRRLKAVAEPRARRRPSRIPQAVDDVTFDIKQGETFALVGESGSRQDHGRAHGGRPAAAELRRSRHRRRLDDRRKQAPAARKLRRRIQMIFQDPYASLNPRFRVDAIVSEPIRAFDLIAGRTRHRRARRRTAEPGRPASPTTA